MSDDDGPEATWSEVPPHRAAVHDVKRAARWVRELAAGPDAPLAAKLAVLRMNEAIVLLEDHYGDTGEPGERLRKASK